MIELTKLNKKKFILNCELIETVESTPDTVITLRNGKLCIVAEPPQRVVELVNEYKRGIFAGTITIKRQAEEDPADPKDEETEE